MQNNGELHSPRLTHLSQLGPKPGVLRMECGVLGVCVMQAGFQLGNVVGHVLNPEVGRFYKIFDLTGHFAGISSGVVQDGRAFAQQRKVFALGLIFETPSEVLGKREQVDALNALGRPKLEGGAIAGALSLESPAIEKVNPDHVLCRGAGKRLAREQAATGVDATLTPGRLLERRGCNGG